MENRLQILLDELSDTLRENSIESVPQEWFEQFAKTAQRESNGVTPASELEALRLEASGCTQCRLHETRTNVVFGCGQTKQPPIAFVGEGPGADEDRVGEPFVGKAGALLTAAITKGLKLAREDVYICNVVKCRPPENRNPLPDEVEHCSRFLFTQLKLIQPRVIVTLGAPALKTLTDESGGITKVRGQWREWEGIPLMPTFHPAYILRTPAAKREFWQDLQEVMQKLGLN